MINKSKSIIRSVKDKSHPFVIIDKTVFEEKSLSYKAKGLMGYILSKPDNWTIRMKDLIKQSTDGRDSVYSAFNELKKAGYIELIEHRNERNQIAGYEYIVHENPGFKSEPEDKTQPVVQAESKCPNLTTIPTSEPFPENKEAEADTDYPETANPPLLINSTIPSNDLTNIPPHTPPNNVREGLDDDLVLLEPISIKLFGQSNEVILAKLRKSIYEYQLSTEVIKECVTLLDAKEIKHCAYGYFKSKYVIATANVAKRVAASAKQRELELIIQQQNSAILAESSNKTPKEYLEEMRKMFGKNTNPESPMSKTVRHRLTPVPDAVGQTKGARSK